MLKVSPINFNKASTANQNSNYEQNRPIRMNSLPMQDTISFGKAGKAVKPLAQNVQKIMGHDFIPNVIIRTWYVSAKPLELNKAHAVAMNINSRTEKINEKLASYRPTQFDKWIEQILVNKHKNVTATASSIEPEASQFGQNKNYVEYLCKSRKTDSKSGFINLRKLSDNTPDSEYVAFYDKRVGSDMQDFLIDVFQNKKAYTDIEIENKNYLIVPDVYGIKILPDEAVPKFP